MKNVMGAGVLLAMSLSGCQEVPIDGATTPNGRTAGYDERSDEFSALVDTLGADTVSITPVGNIPSSGSASYAGHIGIWLDSAEVDVEKVSPTLLGAASFTANFETGQMDGEFDEFVSVDDQVFVGSLSLTGGAITENFVSGNVSGTLNGNYNGTNATITASISAIGGFVGSNPVGLTLVGEGGASINGAPETTASLLSLASVE